MVSHQTDKNLARRSELTKVESDLQASRNRLIERQSMLTSMALRQQAVLHKYSPAAIIAALDITIEQVIID
jgi:hypothetical protein